MIKNVIEQNRKAHDHIYKIYNFKHSEIYNPIEQKRIVDLLLKLTDKRIGLNVLDVGAGTGNLTLKLLDLHCNVTAVDVSQNSLNELRQLSNNNPRIKLLLIEDSVLPFDNNTFDIVCIYSVLHHIPDYLLAVQEMVRVVKPGGLIYIDHELNDNWWNPCKHLVKYCTQTNQSAIDHLLKLIKTKEMFTFDFIKTAFIKIFINKRYKREGDIHVWPDDHIDWIKIKQIVDENSCEIIDENDYLLFMPDGGIECYDNAKSKCSNIKSLIIQKLF